MQAIGQSKASRLLFQKPRHFSLPLLRALCAGIEMDHGIIQRTNQTWKLVILLIFIAIAGTVMLVSLANMNQLDKTNTIAIVLGSVFVGITLFVILINMIKCPNCRAKWFWLAVSGQSSGNWFAWLVGLQQCPKCGETFNESA